MSFTFEGMQAELTYRRDQMLVAADRSRLARLLRRRPADEAGGRRWEQVRDGTDSRGYDLAA